MMSSLRLLFSLKKPKLYVVLPLNYQNEGRWSHAGGEIACRPYCLTQRNLEYGNLSVLIWNSVPFCTKGIVYFIEISPKFSFKKDTSHIFDFIVFSS